MNNDKLDLDALEREAITGTMNLTGTVPRLIQSLREAKAQKLRYGWAFGEAEMAYMECSSLLSEAQARIAQLERGLEQIIAYAAPTMDAELIKIAHAALAAVEEK